MVSSRPVGGGTTDRDRPNERASERATAAPTDDGGGGAGKWDFKLFAVLAIDAVVGTVGREKPEPTERGRRARSAKREREGKNGIVSHRRISVMYSSLGKESFNPY